MDHVEGETADQYFKRILDAVEDAIRKLVETYGIEAAPIAWPSAKGVPNEGVIAGVRESTTAILGKINENLARMPLKK